MSEKGYVGAWHYLQSRYSVSQHKTEIKDGLMVYVKDVAVQ
jgi:hypothetical protein